MVLYTPAPYCLLCCIPFYIHIDILCIGKNKEITRPATWHCAPTAYTATASLSAGIPIAGPFVSAGLGVADAIWGEQLYDWVDDNF